MWIFIKIFKSADDRDNHRIPGKLLNLNQVNVCQITYCNPGYEPKFQSFNTTYPQVEHFNWYCVKCALNMIKIGFSTSYCQKCKAEMKSKSNRTACYDPAYTEVYLQPSVPVILAILSFTSIGILFNIIVILNFVKYRATPIVRASNLDTSYCNCLCICYCLLLYRLLY